MTGKQLRKRRRDLELSQPQIARKLNVAIKTVNNWENKHGGQVELKPIVSLGLNALLEKLERAAKAAE